MKTITIFVFFLLLTQTVIGQVNRNKTAPPVTPVITTNNTISTRTNDSYSYSSDEDGVQTMINVNNSNSVYELNALFNDNETYESLKTLLISELNDANLKKDNSNYSWKVKSNSEIIYEVKLTTKRLNVNVNKELASPALVQKVQDLGTVVKDIIRGDENNDLEQMQRDAERLIRDAKKMEREAHRLLEISNRDAKRLAEEAERLKERAEELKEEAKHQGGVSSLIENLLKEPRTNNAGNKRSSTNWVWPSFQDKLIQQLLTAKLLENDTEITFANDDSGIFVNGTKMSSNQVNNYYTLCSSKGVSKSNKFSFYKKGDHIVIINHNADIEGFFRSLFDAKIVKTLNSPVKLSINGNSILVDGKALSAEQTSTCNTLLQQSNIIGSPGKIIERISSTEYQLGYQIREKTILGTFVRNE